ncbi:enoyl-CoA hydratase/isomerase family protein [Amycolatopsis ultiminotia]|uniref:Enoyl-CoA hydratase/isomerase family protein n=1 Tax=Amycolatopsis ultiminotia TaxID=543629 RepID=A0ABP6UVN6_9PSEU
MTTTQDSVELDTMRCAFPAEGVALLTLNRPDFANGVVPELVRDFLRLLDRLEADNGIRALVLTGAGRQFCAGADLKAMRTYLEERLPVEQEPFNARILFPLTQRLTTSRLPIVAAINGGATAGGLDLALACDLRIASRRAKMGETYVKVGLAPGNGGTYFLPRLVGSGMAAELALTGDVVDAERALAIGLVNHLAEPDELVDDAVALATKLAARPRRAIEATKQALRAAWSQDLTTAMNTSFWVTSALHHTDDLHEGVVAALEKRPPRYNRDRTQLP